MNSANSTIPTYGTGEMLVHALRSSGADRVVIGLGTQ